MKRSVPHQGSFASEEIDTLHAPIIAMAGCAYPFQEIPSPKFSLNVWLDVIKFELSTMLYVLSALFHQHTSEDFGKLCGHP